MGLRTAFVMVGALALPCGPGAAQTLDCLVAPSKVAALAFGSAGVLRQMEVERGDAVAADQVLARLDSSIEESSLQIARAQVAATAARDAAQAQLDLAGRTLARRQELFDRQALPQEKVDEARNDYDQARQRVIEVEEQRRLRVLDVARAEAILTFRTIRSPFAGVVAERYANPGEYVDNKPVLTVAAVDPLYVDLLVPSEQFDAVHPGQQIEVTLDQQAGRQVMARAEVIDPYVDAASGTFRIRAALPNPDHAIIPGFGCTARITDSAAAP